MCIFPHRDGSDYFEPGMIKVVDRELAGVLLAGTVTGLKVWEKLGEIPLVHDESPLPLSSTISVEPEVEMIQIAPDLRVATPKKKK